MVAYVWKTGNSGDWGLATNWTATPSGYPNANTATVTINAAGTYTVTIAGGESYTANTVTLNDSGAVLEVDGTLKLAGTSPALTVTQGEFDLYGELIGGTVKAGAGGSLVLESNATLNGVTWQAPLTFAYDQNLYVTGGLTVKTAAGGTPGSIDMTAGYDRLYVEDSETLNNAILNFGSADQGYLYVYDPSDTGLTLTLGSGFTVEQSGGNNFLTGYTNDTIANAGKIDVTGGDLIVNAGSFTNSGSITISGGGEVDLSQTALASSGHISVGAGSELVLGNGFSNTGSITIASGGTLDLTGAVTLSELTAITVETGATLVISGSLDLGGAVLDIAASGAFSDVVLISGTIANGTIFPDGGSFALGGSSTFDGITYKGELDLAVYTTLTVLDGLTVESAAGTLPGTIVFGYNSTLNVSGGLTVGDAPGSIQLTTESNYLNFYDSETLDHATVTVSGSSDYLDATYYTLTLGADTTVDLSGYPDYLYDSIINLGSIGVTGGVTYFADDYTASTFDNQGSLSVENATLTVSNSTFSNEGSIDIGSGGLLDINSATSFTNSGSITVESGGTLELQSPLTNTGSITIESGGELDLQYGITLADLESSGITIETGATLVISGSLDLGGSVLDIASSGAFSDVVLSGGTIANGTIFPDGGSFTLGSNGTFDGVTYRGELDLADSTTLTVLDGLTVESAAGTLPGTIVFGSNSTLNVSGGLTVGDAPGSIQLANYADYLNLNDSETLDHATVTISGYNDVVDSTEYTLTLGADTTVDLSGSQDYLNDSIINLGSIGVTGGYTYFADAYTASTFDNQGSLSVDNATLTVSNSTFSNEGSIDVGSGGLLDIYSATFTNGGSITVESGGALELQSPLTNTGSITIESGGELDLQYGITLADLESSGITVETGATLVISGSLDLGGAVLDIASSGAFSDVVLSGGTIANGTIFPDSGSFTLGSNATFDGVTYRGELDLADSTTLTVLDGLTVESAAGTLPGTIVFGYNSGLNVSGGLTVGDAPGSIQLGNSYDYLYFDDSETLDHATVTISGYNDVVDSTEYTLTLGADTTVDLSGSQDYLNDSIINLGSIGVTGGYTYFADAYTASTFDNQGSLSVDNATLYVSNSSFSNEGSIDVGSGGLLDIYSATFASTGTITVESGGALDLQDSLTLTELENLGITIEPGGALVISGSLDLGGGVLDLAQSGAFGNVVLSGGTIANGTIFPDGGSFALGGSSTFDGITYKGELDLADYTTLTVLDGLTVESAAGTLPGTIVFGDYSTLNVSGGLTVGDAPGSIQLGNSYDYLYFDDSETLDHANVTISGYYDVVDSVYYTLTLGAGTTVELSGSQDYLRDSITNLGSIGVTGGYTYFADDYTASTFDNQGSLSVDNATLYVQNTTFSNEGTIDVGSGGFLYIDTGAFTSNGAVLVGAGGTLEIVLGTAADVTYNDPATLILDDPTTYAGTLSGFSVGDVLQLNGQDVADASISGTTLTVDLVGGGTLTYATGPGYDGAGFVVSAGTDGYQDRLSYVGNTAGAFIWNASVGSGFWSVPGNWTPNGVPDSTTAKADIIQLGTYTVTVDPTATFTLDAVILDNVDAELDVQGTLKFDGADNTLALVDGTLLVDNGGTIQGATIQSDGGTLASSSGTFDAVTWQGELDLPANSALYTEDGLTVESAAGTLPGTIVFGSSSILYVSGGLTVGAPGTPGSIEIGTDNSYLVFDDTETLNDAIVTVTGSNDQIYSGGAYTLTFGADTTVDLSGSNDSLWADLVNAGSISVSGYTYVNNYYGGTFDNQGSISVGNGTLFINTTNFDNSGQISIGSDGLLEISSGSSLTNTGSLTVESGGTLDLQESLTLTALQAAGITIQSGGTLAISGTLDLQGGTLTIAPTGLSRDLLLDSGTIEDGTIRPDGGTFSYTGGTLDPIIYQGEFDLAASASLTAVGLQVESAAGTLPGTIVFATGSQLDVSGGLTVGATGTPGSIEMNGDNAYFAFEDTETLSHATVTVTGTNDQIYEAGAYTLTLGADTTVNLSGLNDSLWADLVNAGSIGVTGGYTYIYNYYGQTFDNQGTISVNDGALYAETTDFSNEGKIEVGSGGYLDVTSYVGTFTSTTAILIQSGGTLEISPTTAVDVTYDDPALLILDNPTTYTGTLAGIAVGDQLQLNGENVADAVINNGTLTANLVGGGSLTFHADPALNGTSFSISQGSDGGYQDLLTAEIPCFLPGTHIRTTRGEVMVQELAVGDTVITLSGRQRPLSWIGKGRSLAVRGKRSAATPLIVRKGALADNVPNRDLRITKGHSLFLDDVLIPVEFLVNHRSILWDDVTQEVEVYHLELDEHDVLIANGAAAESYRDDGNRWLFQNANSGWDQPPKPPCAPVLTGGPIVDAVWRRLLDRAGGPTRLPLTQDAQLALLVDGVRVAPTVLNKSMAVFILPRRPGEIRLVSRSAVPLELGLARDARELGVAFEWLAVRKGAKCRMVGAEDARLTEGFHPFEAAEGIRWTNGDALLPGELFAGFKGEFEVAINLSGATSYVMEGELLQAA